jgi:hypothetical protein
MILYVNWNKPIQLRSSGKGAVGYSVDLDKVPDSAGVYIFGRQFGNNFEALYVGKASRIRSRIRTHFNNLRLMEHLRDAKTGRRVLLAGVLDARQGQKIPTCLPIIERALIRHFLSEGHDLVNKQGTHIKHHEILSDGKHPKKYFPRTIYTEKN